MNTKCANHEPGARVCSSNHYIIYIYLLRIPMYWVYLNGYMKRVGAPWGVAPLLWLSIYIDICTLWVAETAVALTKNTRSYVRRKTGPAYIYFCQLFMYVEKARPTFNFVKTLCMRWGPPRGPRGCMHIFPLNYRIANCLCT